MHDLAARSASPSRACITISRVSRRCWRRSSRLTIGRVLPQVQEVAESAGPASGACTGRWCCHHRRPSGRRLGGLLHRGGPLSLPEFMTAHMVKRDRCERFFRRIIEDGIARGVSPPGPAALGLALLGMCNAAVR